jgi:hypothetical protein
MKKLYFALLYFIILIGAAWGQSEIRLSADNFDFGFVPQNAKVNCGFWVYSVGRDTLKIDRVKTTCGCTRAPLKTYVLPPGDSTYLEITFSTRQYKGEMSRLIHIIYASDSSIKSLEIKANVQKRMDLIEPAVIDPYKIDISQFGDKIRDKARFSIKNKSDRDFRLTLIYYPKGYFDINLPEDVEAGKKAEGEVKIKKDADFEKFNKSFTIELNDEAHTRYTIPVSRVIRELGTAQSEE